MICTRNRDRSFRGKDKAKHFYFIAHSYTTSARAGKDELYLQTGACAASSPPLLLNVGGAVGWPRWQGPNKDKVLDPLAPRTRQLGLTRNDRQHTGHPASWPGVPQCHGDVSESGQIEQKINMLFFFFHLLEA